MDLEKFDETALETNYSSRFNSFSQCYHLNTLQTPENQSFSGILRGIKG